MKKILAIALSVILLLSLVACGGKTYTKTGSYSSYAIEGLDEIEYVFAISKNAANGDKYLTEINKIIAYKDMAELLKRYTDGPRPWDKDYLGEIDVSDNKGLDPIIIYTAVLTPFQFSGAYGAGVDGLDMYIMAQMAENLNMEAKFQDTSYELGYEKVKRGEGEILASAVVLTEEVKADFKVSNVYLKSKLHIVCDKGYAFTSLKELKGFKVGVIPGRYSAKLVKEALGDSAEIVEFFTDAEAKAALQFENIDAFVIDELSAKHMVGLLNK